MMPFDKCPICGGELEERDVEKLLRGGHHTAVLKVQAEVCMHCCERLYPVETVRLFENIRNRLKREQLSGFLPLDQLFMVDRSSLDMASVSEC